MQISIYDLRRLLKVQKAIVAAITTLHNMYDTGPTTHAIKVILEDINTKISKMVESGEDEGIIE